MDAASETPGNGTLGATRPPRSAPIPTDDLTGAISDRRRRAVAPKPAGCRFGDDPMLVALFNAGAIAIGGELYRCRVANEWSQQDLALASGLSQDTIERMERGLSNFGFESFVRAFTPFGLPAFGRALTAAATAYKRAIP
jgi:hypothetical protein